MHAITQEKLPDPKTVRADLPEDVVKIVRRALARDRDQRFASAADMGEALSASLRRHAPGMSASDLAGFLLDVFGQEALAKRKHVPKLPEARRPSMTAVSPVGKLITTAVPAVASPPAVPAVTDAVPSEVPVVRRATVFWAMGAAALALVAATAFSLLTGSPPGQAAAPDKAQARAAGEPAQRPAVSPPPPPAAALLPAALADTPAPAAQGATLPQARAGSDTEPVRPRPARPLEPLDAAALEAVVRRSHARLSACFKQHEGVLPAAEGQVNVEVAVTAAGRVSFAKAELPAAAGDLARCLEQQSRRLRFPRHPDKQLRFAFPLIYRKED